MTIKLNIGSANPKGRYRKLPWVCVDRQKSNDGVFVQADGTNLPFRDSSVEEIHCIHMMEHIHRDQNLPLVKEFFRVLQPGASAFIEVPDFTKIFQAIINLEKLLDQKLTKEQRFFCLERIRCFRLSIYGKGRHADDFHQWAVLRSDVAKYAEVCGFRYKEETEMISEHHSQEPVVLFRLTKPS